MLFIHDFAKRTVYFLIIGNEFMTLGLLVTRDDCKEDVVGLATAAAEKSHTVMIFMMDDGVRLCEDRDVRRLEDVPGIVFSLCALNMDERAISKEGIPGGIEIGSQYQNAQMVHNSDRVIVL